MIVIKVELWPGGFESLKQTLGTGVIFNDGTGTKSRGNYVAKFIRRDVDPTRLARGDYKSARSTVVENFPRLTKNAWHLMTEAFTETWSKLR